MRRRRHGRGNNPFVLLMMLQLLRKLLQSDWVPPVTLAVFGVNAGLYFFPHPALPGLQEVCLLPAMVLGNGDLLRVLLSPFYHASDTHIYYNMASFVYKGMRLERHFGSERFAHMIVAMLLGSQALYVAIAVAADAVGHSAPMMSCAVGFSGVLFALKVILSFLVPPHMQSVWGIPIHSRYAAWLELVIIQVVTPHASFLGHLAGILAGLAWVFAPRLIKRLQHRLGYDVGWNFGAGHAAPPQHRQQQFNRRQPTQQPREQQQPQRAEGGTQPQAARNEWRAQPRAEENEWRAQPQAEENEWRAQPQAEENERRQERVDAEAVRAARLRRFG